MAPNLERGVQNLKPLANMPEYAEAAASNMAFITSCRDEARDSLASAAASGKLVFTREHGGVLTGEELDALDDEDVA